MCRVLCVLREMIVRRSIDGVQPDTQFTLWILIIQWATGKDGSCSCHGILFADSVLEC